MHIARGLYQAFFSLSSSWDVVIVGATHVYPCREDLSLASELVTLNVNGQVLLHVIGFLTMRRHHVFPVRIHSLPKNRIVSLFIDICEPFAERSSCETLIDCNKLSNRGSRT